MSTFDKRRTFAAIVVAMWLFASAAAGQCLDDDQYNECEGDQCLVQIFVELEGWGLIDDVLTALPGQEMTLVDSIPAFRFHLIETTVDIPDGQEAEDVVEALVEQLDEQKELLGAKKFEPHRLLETPEGVQLSIPDLGIVAEEQDFTDQPAADTVQTHQAQTKYTGLGVTVAVIDTGMAFDHPTTAAQILVPGKDFAGGNGTAESQANNQDDDGDGLFDESEHHATFVAGLVKLVAPDARILPIRVLETDGKGTTFGVAKGILHAVDLGVDVINLSSGMLHESRAIEQALEVAEDAGIVIVAAAGNRGLQLVEENLDDCKAFPAYRDEVIAVAAVDANLVKAEFSDFGNAVDLSAPGVDLVSTWGSDDFAGWSGTSFAAPLVSGAVALVLEKYPCLSPADVLTMLTGTTQPDNNPAVYDGLMGSGVLDLDALTDALATDRCSLKMERASSGTVVRWSPVKDATSYDVARGNLADIELLPAQDTYRVSLGTVSCLANDIAQTDTATAPDAETPASGEVFFYLFRDDLSGISYGQDSDGNQRYAREGDCASPGG